MLIADTKVQFRTVFDHIEKAHQHAAEAMKTLRELHKKLPLDVFLRVADCAVQLLVILHIPKTEAVVQKLRQAATRDVQLAKAGSTSVQEVMIKRNLPKCGKWMEEDQYKPRKMIASLVHKYIRDVMFKQQMATHLIVKQFRLPQTTIHRQIYGKKYLGVDKNWKR